MKKIRQYFVFLASLLLTGCGGTIKELYDKTFSQAGAYQDRIMQKKVDQYYKSLSIYDQFETAATFSGLWLSDEIKTVLSDIHVQMLAKGNDVRNNFLRRQLKENTDTISFYVLTPHDVSLSEQPCLWQLHLEVGGKNYAPTSIKLIEVSAEYRRLLGSRLTNFNDVYDVKFSRKDDEGNDIMAHLEPLKLCFNGVKYYGVIEWSLDAHKKFLHTLFPNRRTEQASDFTN